MIVRELISRLGFQVDHKSISKYEQRLQKAKQAMRSVANAAKATAVAVTGIGLAAAGAGAGLLRLVESVTAVGDQAAKDAQRLGLTAEAVQELGHAAKLSGADFGGVKMGLQIFSRHLGDALTKGGEAAEVFKRMGISMDDPVLRSRDLEKILPSLADRFSKMPDGAEKTALAMELFGRSGTDLIPLLNEGSAGIASMRQELRDMGGVISGDAAKAMERFNDDLDRTKAGLAGIVTSVVSEMMPTFQDWLGQLREWIAENRELLKQRVREFIERAATALKTIVPLIGQAIKMVIDLAEGAAKLADKIGGAEVALIAFAAIFAPGGVWGAALTAGIAAIVIYMGKMDELGAKSRELMEDITRNARATADAMTHTERIARKGELDRRISARRGELIAAEVERRKSQPGARGLISAAERARVAREIDAGLLANDPQAGGFIAERDAIQEAIEGGGSRAEAAAGRDTRATSGIDRMRAAADRRRAAAEAASVAVVKPKRRGRGAGASRAKPEREKTLADLIGLDRSAADLGAFNSKAENPVLGTTINRTDINTTVSNEFHVTQRPGESSDGLTDRLVVMIRKELEHRDRRIANHFRGATG
jgi:hypothetical protein